MKNKWKASLAMILCFAFAFNSQMISIWGSEITELKESLPIESEASVETDTFVDISTETGEQISLNAPDMVDAPETVIQISDSSETVKESEGDDNLIHQEMLEQHEPGSGGSTDGVDFWGFSNSNPNCFGEGKEGYRITKTDYNRLVSSAPLILKDDFWLALNIDGGIGVTRKWNGSCYGMSASMVRVNAGRDSITDYRLGSNITALNEITPEVLYSNNNCTISSSESVINYYQFQQWLPEFESVKCSYKGLPIKDQILAIASIAKSVQESGKPGIIGYFWKDNGNITGHFICIIGHRDVTEDEYESYKYSHCILTYDCNVPEEAGKKDSDFNIYYNEKGEWSCSGLEAAYGIKQDDIVYFCGTDDPQLIGPIDYPTGIYTKTKSMPTHIDYFASNGSWTVKWNTKQVEIQETEAIGNNRNDVLILPEMVGFSDSEPQKYSAYIPDGMDYVISATKNLDHTLLDDNRRIQVASDKKATVNITAASQINMSAEEICSMDISVVSNTRISTLSYPKVSLSDPDTKSLSIKNTTKGLKITSDDFQNAAITFERGDESKITRSLSAFDGLDQVYVSEKNGIPYISPYEDESELEGNLLYIKMYSEFRPVLGEPLFFQGETNTSLTRKVFPRSCTNDGCYVFDLSDFDDMECISCNIHNVHFFIDSSRKNISTPVLSTIDESSDFFNPEYVEDNSIRTYQYFEHVFNGSEQYIKRTDGNLYGVIYRPVTNVLSFDHETLLAKIPDTEIECFYADPSSYVDPSKYIDDQILSGITCFETVDGYNKSYLNNVGMGVPLTQACIDNGREKPRLSSAATIYARRDYIAVTLDNQGGFGGTKKVYYGIYNENKNWGIQIGRNDIERSGTTDLRYIGSMNLYYMDGKKAINPFPVRTYLADSFAEDAYSSFRLPSKEGYYLEGYYTQPNGKGTLIYKYDRFCAHRPFFTNDAPFDQSHPQLIWTDEAADILTDNTVLYAHWVKPIKLTIDMQGGTHNGNTIEYMYKAPYYSDDSTYYSQYKYDWYIDSACTTTLGENGGLLQTSVTNDTYPQKDGYVWTGFSFPLVGENTEGIGMFCSTRNKIYNPGCGRESFMGDYVYYDSDGNSCKGEVIIDTTIYAQWLPVYRITLDNQGGADSKLPTETFYLADLDYFSGDYDCWNYSAYSEDPSTWTTMEEFDNGKNTCFLNDGDTYSDTEKSYLPPTKEGYVFGGYASGKKDTDIIYDISIDPYGSPGSTVDNQLTNVYKYASQIYTDVYEYEKWGQDSYYVFRDVAFQKAVVDSYIRTGSYYRYSIDASQHKFQIGKQIDVSDERITPKDRTLYAIWIPKSGGGNTDDTDSIRITHSEVAAQIYTGSKIIPSLNVYCGETLLHEKEDYTIAYSNNTNVGNDAKITITGKGNYSGSVTDSFIIVAKNIGADDVSISEIASAAYNKKGYSPVPTITYNKRKLANKKDFIIAYYKDEDCSGAKITPKEGGKYYAEITGINNFTGSIVLPFEIAKADQIPVSKLRIEKIADKPYANGSKITPKLIIKSGNLELTEGKHYTLSWGANSEIGTGTVVVTGIDPYVGSKTVSFKITGIPMNKVNISGIPRSVVYNGTPETPIATLNYKASRSAALQEIECVTQEQYDHELSDEDRAKVGCIISYKNNDNVGTATVTLTGIHGCSGTVNKTFKITPFDVTKDPADLFKVSLNKNSYPYAKGGVKPEPTVTYNGTKLTPGKDYTVSYVNNNAVNARGGKRKPTVRVAGKGNYKGIDATTTFEIVTADMEGTGVVVVARDVEFNKSPGKWTTKFTVVGPDGKELKAGTDYNKNRIEYSYATTGEAISPNASVAVGTEIKIKVYGAGSFTGSTEGKYRIISEGYDISKLKATVKLKPYTGERITLSKDDITWESGKKKITGVEFVIEESTYRNNLDKGNATVIVRGTGAWGGYQTLTFSIGTRAFILE